MHLSNKKIIHVSAWAKTFTQFRMPLIRTQKDIFKKVLIYCPYESSHIERLIEEGFEVKIAPVSGKVKPEVIFQIIKLYRYLKKEHFDILAAHQPMGALVGITAASLAGVPIKIYSTGGLKYCPDKNRKLNNILKYGELGIIKSADAVFLVNKEDEALLICIPSVKDKAYYVGPRGGCGIDTERFSLWRRLELRDKARKNLEIGEDTLLVGYAGRCIWKKGFKEIVDAACILKEKEAGEKIQFLVLGEGQHLPAIKNYMDQKGLNSMFNFLGYKFNIDFYMSAFDIFILPSYREGLPVSLLEAMALGIPSIATNVRGNRDLIKDGETGLLVPVGEVDKLARAILYIKNSPDKGAYMGKRASEYVINRYSESVMVDKTMGIINNLIEKKLSG